MRYPIGIQTFEKLRQEGCVYVDKTDLVYKLVTEGNVYFLSRPRRFGKSLLISTLESYFLGKKELFKGLKIDALEKDWIEYPVFILSFTEGIYKNQNTVVEKITDVVVNGEQKYGVTPAVDDLNVRFYNILKAAYEKTGRRAVVLVDEYDKPLLDVMDLKDCVATVNGREIPMEEYNRDMLKGIYSVFKAADAYLKFVMLTGVTKFSQISVFSGFNQPNDISMDRAYEALCGITKDELLTVFDEPIHQLAEVNGWSYEKTVATLKERYDGYHFGKNMTDIYNPFSLINCFSKMDVSNYWFRSGTPTYLVRLLHSSNQNINELVGKYYEAGAFVDYRANVQKPLPMIYQSGYFTIKGYDRENESYLLDFPNEEVRTGFIDVLAADYFGEENVDDCLGNEMRAALESGDVEEFMYLITGLMASAPYHLQRKKDARECERYFQASFYYIIGMTVRRNTVLQERPTSRGRIDCVIECPNFVYIMEFKLNDSAENALKQIKDKGYAQSYAADKRKVMMIGVRFSSETGTIEEWKANAVEDNLPC